MKIHQIASEIIERKRILVAEVFKSERFKAYFLSERSEYDFESYLDQLNDFTMFGKSKLIVPRDSANIVETFQRLKSRLCQFPSADIPLRKTI